MQTRVAVHIGIRCRVAQLQGFVAIIGFKVIGVVGVIQVQQGCLVGDIARRIRLNDLESINQLL